MQCGGGEVVPYPSSVLQLGGGEDPTLDFRHLVANRDAEGLQVRVIVEVSFADLVAKGKITAGSTHAKTCKESSPQEPISQNILIQIQWKFRFTAILFMVMISSLMFAHGRACNDWFIKIWAQNEASIEFELHFSELGPRYGEIVKNGYPFSSSDYQLHLSHTQMAYCKT